MDGEQSEQIHGLLHVLQHVHTYPIALQADYTRENSQLVAIAAARGFITCEIIPGSYRWGRLWKITAAGLQWLTDNAVIIRQEVIDNYDALLASELEVV